MKLTEDLEAILARGEDNATMRFALGSAYLNAGRTQCEVQRLVHPSATITVKLGNKAVHSRVVDSVWGYFAVYVVVFGALMLFLLANGVDQVTAFSAIAATINNLGPGLGEVANGYGDLNALSKWCVVCAMLLGRLEIFTLLVLITPIFWRR